MPRADATRCVYVRPPLFLSYGTLVRLHPAERMTEESLETLGVVMGARPCELVNGHIVALDDDPNPEDAHLSDSSHSASSGVSA